MPKHAVNWFEIPVTNMDRAVAFYEEMLGITMERMTVGTPVAVFPHDEGGVGGALSLDGREPSSAGSVVYLEVDGALQDALDRVQGAGGEVVLPFTEIGEGYGYYAYVRDSEGNQIGLYETLEK